ncbi:MAG: spore germination protein, partial [Lachnospiraceae bacterium]|nr:spore germination protein [Lachnospiraceae bacterium]
MKLSTSLSANVHQLHLIFPIEKSFDLITRSLCIGQTKAYWLGINGFCTSEILLRILSDLQNHSFHNNETIDDLRQFMASRIGYIQAEQTQDLDTVIKSVLSGVSVLLVDGFDYAILLDA